MKFKYFYYPHDEESDYHIGNAYKGKVIRTIVTRQKHPRAVEVVFSDGKTTIVHKRSFEVSNTAIEFYPPGVSIKLKKVGYMADRRITKWVILSPLKYDFYHPDGIQMLQDNKRQKAGESGKYRYKASPLPDKNISLREKFKNALTSIIPLQSKTTGNA